MRVNLRKLLIAAAVLGCLFVLKAPSAAADDYTYTFTTAAPSVLTGTTFEIDTTGFLSFGATKITPTSVSDLFYAGTDEGLITSVEFNAPTLFTINAVDLGVDFSLTNSYNVGAVGSYPLEEVPPSGVVLVQGTLDIVDVGSGPSVPEPRSGILLATGLLGLLIFIRQKTQPFAA